MTWCDEAVVFELGAVFAFVIFWTSTVVIRGQTKTLRSVLTRAALTVVYVQLKAKSHGQHRLLSNCESVFQCRHRNDQMWLRHKRVFWHECVLLTWHVTPEKPGGHRHWNPLAPSWQRPPLRQGRLAHSSTSRSQCSPEKPGAHRHRYPLTRSWGKETRTH